MILFVFVLPAAVGIYLFWTAARDLLRGFASRSWPTTEGSVTESSLKEEKYVRRGGETSMILTHRWHISYRYVVEGNEYASTHVYFGGLFHSYSWAWTVSNLLSRYPQDKRVTVYYNPGKPQLAVLEPGIRVGRFFGTLIRVVLGVCLASWVSVLLGLGPLPC